MVDAEMPSGVTPSIGSRFKTFLAQPNGHHGPALLVLDPLKNAFFPFQRQLRDVFRRPSPSPSFPQKFNKGVRYTSFSC